MIEEVERLKDAIAELKGQGESKEESILIAEARKASVSYSSVSLKPRYKLRVYWSACSPCICYF